MAFADSKIKFPDLWLEIFIVGDVYEQKRFAQMFLKSFCTKADTPEDADLVIFTGGEDVNPQLYDEARHHSTHFNNKRDADDMTIYSKCLEQGIPMFGVCRGAQFLHVMNGGKLFQDVDGHNGSHVCWDVKSKKVISNVSSVHHQMCITNTDGGMEVLLDSFRSEKRWRNDKEFDIGKSSEVEAYWYRDTACFGVQGHPEYSGHDTYMLWCLDKIESLINHNPDLEIRNNKRRMKLDIIAQRDQKWAEARKELETN